MKKLLMTGFGKVADLGFEPNAVMCFGGDMLFSGMIIGAIVTATGVVIGSIGIAIYDVVNDSRKRKKGGE